VGDTLRLNNKGFAISSIMYIILVLAVILISLILVTLSSRKLILDKLREEVLENIYYVPSCILIDDVDSSETVTPGDKYQCKVKDDMEEGFEDGYYFYVIGANDDGTTNLIMERNIYYDEINDVGMVATETNNGLVQWYSGNNNKSGPVTAMDYLYNATKDWSNIPNIVMNYIDEGNNYGTIATTKNVTKITEQDGSAVTVLTDKEGYTNLKARMPYYSEVTGEGKCTTGDGSCPLWLSNYLANNKSVTGEGLQNINGIKGYWVISTRTNYANYAWHVNISGRVYNNYVISSGNLIGVRPVITVKI
jgi:hypothetical protein